MADLTIHQVIQASEKFYSMEAQFKNAKLLNWFGDILQRIVLKTQSTSHAGFNACLLRIIPAVIEANQRLVEIESPIVHLFHQRDNTVFDEVWMRKFTLANKTCMKELYKRFQSMQTSIPDLQQSVSNCVERYEKQVFDGQLYRILQRIENLLKYNPGEVVGNFKKTFDIFEQNIVEPLRQLPEIEDYAFIVLKSCIEKQYGIYEQIRLVYHNQIQQLADEVPNPKLKALFK